MRRLWILGFGIWCALTLAGTVLAATYQLNSGQTLSGEVLSYNEIGVILKLGEGKYSDRVGWGDFSQADLQTLAKNPKIQPLVGPFIEVPQEERLKRTEVPIKPVPRLERPEPGPLLGAMLTSSVGLMVLLVLYAANLYAAYEVAKFRTRPVLLLCGVAAVLPFIGPVIFLALPVNFGRDVERFPHDEPDEEPPPREVAKPAVVEAEPAPVEPVAETVQSEQPEEAPEAEALPETQVFQRGQYTFNRRFFETKFSAYFNMMRLPSEKDMVLVVRAVRGEYVARRISRIAANDMHLEIQKGIATKEVMVPFIEIQEVQLKHKDA